MDITTATPTTQPLYVTPTKYPFNLMKIGDYKQRRFLTLKAAKAARAAAYSMAVSKGWRFRVTIKVCPPDEKGRQYWFQIWRYENVASVMDTLYIDCKFNGLATYELVRTLARHQVLRVDFLYGRDMQKFKEYVTHPLFAGTKLLRIRKEPGFPRLIVSTTYVDPAKVQTPQAMRTGKYPFNTMQVGDHIKFDLGGVRGLARKLDRARKAAYVMASVKKWKFELKTEGSCLNVWRWK